mmetsp:Transcript_19599/g.39280  ORF Transcript_19599/g.39280 Transcript_19599/m.39280 type:complete len:210 (-) Transcript_19599:1346-1975(-)
MSWDADWLTHLCYPIVLRRFLNSSCFEVDESIPFALLTLQSFILFENRRGFHESSFPCWRFLYHFVIPSVACNTKKPFITSHTETIIGLILSKTLVRSCWIMMILLLAGVLSVGMPRFLRIDDSRCAFRCLYRHLYLSRVDTIITRLLAQLFRVNLLTKVAEDILALATWFDTIVYHSFNLQQSTIKLLCNFSVTLTSLLSCFLGILIY